MIFGLNKKNLLKLKMWWDLLNERYLVMNVDILMGFKMIKNGFYNIFFKKFFFLFIFC